MLRSCCTMRAALIALTLLVCPVLQAEKIILTGAPGSGKTSIAIALELRGEKILREAAADMIQYRLARGFPAPWAMLDFQDVLAKLMLQRDRDLPDGGRVFMDRSIFDCFGYFSWLGMEPSQEFLDLAGEFNKESFHKDVFLIRGLGEVQKTAIRSENAAQAMKIEDNLRKAYLTRGFNIIDVPAAPLDERVDFILDKLARHPSTQPPATP